MTQNYINDKLLIIDADVCVYACGFICEKKMHLGIVGDTLVYQTDDKRKYNKWFKALPQDKQERVVYDLIEELWPFSEARIAVDGWIKNIMELSGCNRYHVLLTKGGMDFRTHLATLLKYKGNRDDLVKPVYYKDIRNYLRSRYKAKTYAKWEADDAARMAMYAAKDRPKTKFILAAVDKDLDQTPGLHCAPGRANKKHGVFQVTELDGWWSFYKQMLMGDRVDNIPGIKGIGEKKAEKLLLDCETREDMELLVWQEYVKYYGHAHTYIPWWWNEKYDDPAYADAAFVEAKRKKYPKKKVMMPVGVVFQEIANLLYMLRTPDDRFIPITLDILECGCWVDYPSGIVKAILGGK